MYKGEYKSGNGAGKCLSSQLELDGGLHQGLVICLYLFFLFMDNVMEDIKDEVSWHLSFVDDMLSEKSCSSQMGWILADHIQDYGPF